MLRIKMFLMICVLLVSFVGVQSVGAADPELLIEFSMDAEAALTVTEYRLHVIKVPGSGSRDFVGTLPNNDPTKTIWQDVFYDIPMGKTLDWYLESVDVDGDSGWSPAYQFKLTGQAVIITIRRVRR